MEFDCSIILCTHNPHPDYLRAALDSIKAQTLPKNQWELLLVDNASRERLETYLDLSWHPNARHVREDELGLTAARLRGIHESKASSLVFVDDDNVLSPDYIAVSLALFQTHPWLGVIGAGILRPKFEKEPDPKFQRLLRLLAIRNVPREIWSNNPDDAAGIPWGAGLCVRRTIAYQYVDLLRKLNVTDCVGRHGGELTCGEDDLFSFAATFNGVGFGVFPELQITHVIPATRVSESYFLRLVEGHGFSHALIGHLLNRSSGLRPGGLSSLRGILSAARLGLFDLRVELAVQRGVRRAQQYVTKSALEPICL
jgi:glycosyltransferase involved in cell wall biosynthesis